MLTLLKPLAVWSFYFHRDEGSYALFLNFSEASSFASSPTFSLLAYLLSSIARAGKTTFASSFWQLEVLNATWEKKFMKIIVQAGWSRVEALCEVFIKVKY